MEQLEKREARERTIKFILCTVLCMLAGELTGGAGTPTIAVTALLTLHIDRGFTGAMKQSRGRILSQVLAGGIVFPTILILKSFLPVEGWIISMLAAVFGIAVGMPLSERYHIAPLPVTFGNSVLIMTVGIMGSSGYYPMRVLYCILGAVIAHIINFALMPQPDRYERVCSQLQAGAALLLGEEPRRLSKEALCEVQVSEEFIEKQLAFLSDDERWNRHRPESWQLTLAGGLLEAEKSLLYLTENLPRWAHKTAAEFPARYRRHFACGVALHKSLLAAAVSGTVSDCTPLTLPTFSPGTPSENVLTADLIEYLACLNRILYTGLAGAETGAPAASPAPMHSA